MSDDTAARIARLERQVRGLALIVTELVAIVEGGSRDLDDQSEPAGEEQLEAARERLRGRLAKRAGRAV